MLRQRPREENGLSFGQEHQTTMVSPEHRMTEAAETKAG